MAETFEGQGAAGGFDPTFEAYRRARQFSEESAKLSAQKEQHRATEDVLRGTATLGFEQQDALEAAKSGLRARGFGSRLSGPRAQAESRINRDIALRVQELLTGYQRTSQDITDELVDSIAAGLVGEGEEASEARRRVLLGLAESGMGI